MDKNTLSEFGWTMIIVMMLAIVLAAVPGLLSLVTSGADKMVGEYLG